MLARAFVSRAIVIVCLIAAACAGPSASAEPERAVQRVVGDAPPLLHLAALAGLAVAVLAQLAWLGVMRRRAGRTTAGLRAAEASLHEAQSIAHIGSWRADLSTQTVDWSPQARRIFGFSSDVAVGTEAFRGLVHPDDFDDVSRAWQAGMAGAASDIEHRIVVGGQTRWVRQRARFTLNAQGRAVSVIGTTQDISEWHDAADRLRESEERFRNIFEETRQAITLIEDGRFVAANRASLAMLGMERLDQLVGRTPAEISPPNQPDGRSSVDKAVELIGAAFAQGSNEFEWEHLRADGQRFSAKILLTVIPHNGAQLLHVVWSDITAQTQAQRELAEYRRELEQRVTERTAELSATAESLRAVSVEQQVILDTATSGIALVRDMRVARVNRRMSEMFGTDPSGMAGRLVTSWVADRDHEQLVKTFDVIWREKVSHSLTMELTRADGSRFWARVTGCAVDRNDPALGSVWVVDDITAELAAVDESHKAQALAEEAARVKADFLANMSHEIRTPMNAIIGMTYLILRTELTGRQRDQLAKIQGASRLLLRIVDDILDFSKVEAGMLVVESTDFEISQVFTDMEALIADKASAKGLKLTHRVIDGVPARLVGDPVRVGQVLLNFVDNAVKFTEHGEVDVRVELVRLDGEEVVLKFTVRDTGIGLDRDKCASLFQVFQQADSSITRRFGGTGLGLAICKRLAGLMGGDVGVVSSPGAGSTFWFTARLGVGDPARAGTSQDSARTGAQTSKGDAGEPAQEDLAQLHSARVLLVEDNELNQEITFEFLQSAGVAVDVAENGAAALAKIFANRYDAVLMDVQMPVMDGLTATREIRLQRGLEGLPIIAMTANVMSIDRERCLAAGMNDHLAKPIDPAQLYAMLARWIRTSRTPAPPVTAEAGGDATTARASTAAGFPTTARSMNMAEPVPPSQAFSAIPGLDAALGLRQSLGRETLYRSILGKFVSGHAQDVSALATALADGDMTTARRVAHTLKGVSAQIGAMDLRAVAERAELAITQGESEDVLAGLLAELEESLSALVAALAARLG